MCLYTKAQNCWHHANVKQNNLDKLSRGQIQSHHQLSFQHAHILFYSRIKADTSIFFQLSVFSTYKTQHNTLKQTHTILLLLWCNGPTGSQGDINSDNVPSAQWILVLLTTLSARLDPIIKVSSKETNWISAGICNWKLAFNDALWSRAEPSADINQASLCRDRSDCVVHCSINTIEGIEMIWSWGNGAVSWFNTICPQNVQTTGSKFLNNFCLGSSFSNYSLFF